MSKPKTADIAVIEALQAAGGILEGDNCIMPLRNAVKKAGFPEGNVSSRLAKLAQYGIIKRETEGRRTIRVTLLDASKVDQLRPRKGGRKSNTEGSPAKTLASTRRRVEVEVPRLSPDQLVSQVLLLPISEQLMLVGKVADELAYRTRQHENVLTELERYLK